MELTDACLPEEIAPVDPDSRVPFPSREDWIERPNIAFGRLIRSIPVPTGGPYAAISVRQYEAMFGTITKYMTAQKRPTDLLTIDEHVINRFLCSLRGREPEQPGLKKEEKEAVIARQREVLVETKRRYIHLFTLVLDRLVKAGYRKTNPSLEAARFIPGRGGAESEIVFLDEEQDLELQRYLREDFDTSTWKQRRWQAMLLFILGTGVMPMTAREATVDDFVWGDTVPAFDVKKKRASDGHRVPSHRIPISGFCLGVVQTWVCERDQYLSSRECGDYTGRRLAFPSEEEGGELSHVALWHTVSESLRAIRFPGVDIGPRVLRNTFIRRQIAAGVPMDEILGVCGLQTGEKTVQRLWRMTLSRTVQLA